MLKEATCVHNRADKTVLRNIVVHIRLIFHPLAVKPDCTLCEKQTVLPKEKCKRRPKEVENEHWSWECCPIVLSIIRATKELAVII